MAKSIIRIGPAGWSYNDWEGTVDSQKPGKAFDPLEFPARLFNNIAIDSSVYRPPTPSTTKSWANRVAANKQFEFTAKLNRLFTHERGKATKKDEKEFRSGMDVLAKAGKLGSLLLQFPWSFKTTPDDRIYLAKLLEKFSDYPLVLEVRHASWNNPEFYEWLDERGVGICNIDQPVFSKSIRPQALTTSRIGYVRLHGRNYQNWFREKAAPHERYDYLYSLDELDPWLVRIEEVAKQTRETYVITNNHFRGQGVVNALEIKAALDEKTFPAPEPLFKVYQRLSESATPSENQTSERLFE